MTAPARSRRPARSLHPLAWWGWALGLAVAASMTTNPLLLVLIALVTTLVVTSRRGDSPWSRAFKLYAILALVIIVFRAVLHVLVGYKFGEILLLPLPEVDLPAWAAGIQVLGRVYLEGLLGAVLQGAKLGVLILAIGGANALANPKRLLRSLPNALHEVGTAIVVSVSVAPQLAESVQRVLRARLLRGDDSRGLRAVPRVALPVLQDTLDRSLLLAAAMESRGYGRHAEGGRNRLTSLLTLLGLLVLALGMYGVLAPQGPAWMGLPTLLAGVGLLVLGMVLGGRAVRVTTYRPDPWGIAETATVLCGVAAAAGAVVTRRLAAVDLGMPLQPLGPPTLPIIAACGILLAALPAFLTPPPAEGRSR